ncbi:MAG: YbgC/FadM family acyl-CoA thioesterase [Pseudomonadota bacterium]
MNERWFEIRVYFEDTDFSGRVYHGAFVHFLERARTEFLREHGIDHTMLASDHDPLFFTLRGLNLSFKGPAFIDDLLAIRTEPGPPGRARLTMMQTVFRDESAIASAEVELCLIDKNGRPRRPPDALRRAFAQHSGDAL